MSALGAYSKSAQSAPSQANPAAQKPAPEPGQISGHVRRADTGAPVAKAEVTLIPLKVNPDVRQDPRFFAVTDAEGAFAISNVGPGNYAVLVNHSGFVSRNTYSNQNVEDSEMINLGAGEVLDRVDIRLVPAGVISGTVSDEDNEPIAAVTVEAVRIRYARGGRRLESLQLRVWTDDQGNFRLYGLPQGNYFVRIEVTNVSAQTRTPVSRIAYYPGTPEAENAQPLRVTPGNEISGIHFSVAPITVYSVAGNIVDASGLAGQGRYEVTAMNEIDAANDGGRITRATSGPGGSFALHGLAAGTYSIFAGQLEPESGRVSERSLSGSAIVRVSDGDARANIQVGADVEVGGRIAVENSGGKPGSGISVMLWAQNSIITNPNLNSLKATTDQRGNFRIKYVSSGSYDFTIVPDTGTYLKQIVCNGKDYTVAPLTIEGGANVSDCVLTLGTDAGIVRGQVLDGDKPVPGRVVVAIPEDLSKRRLERFTFTANTNAKGEYQLSSVIPGDYLLFAVPPNDDHLYFNVDFADRNQRDAERVSVKSGESKNIPLKPTAPQ